MKIALVSLDQIWEDKFANLVLCEEYVEYASQKNVDLIIFPEMTLTGFSMKTDHISENIEESQTISKFKSFAKKFKISIIFGLVLKEMNKSSNNAILIDQNGSILSHYKKIHPFSFAGEDQYYVKGDNLAITQLIQHNIGLTICYDLRFPELYSIMADKCDIVINIANWPKKRVEHWRCLLKARAIENQIFLIGVNRIGEDGNKHQYEESSLIYDANGVECDPIEYYETMKIYNIDKSFTNEFKNKFNTVQDKRSELYKRLED
jgi:predicted amidohydrolase